MKAEFKGTLRGCQESPKKSGASDPHFPGTHYNVRTSLNTGENMKRIAVWCLGLSLMAGVALAGPGEKAKPAASNGAEVSVPKMSTFREAYDAGNKFLREHKYAEAVQAYQQAEGLASSNSVKSQAVNAAGWALVKGRKWSEAKAMMQKAVELDPKNKVALANVGYTGLKMHEYGLGTEQDFEDAVAALEACSAIDPAYKAELLENAKTIQSRLAGDKDVTPVPEPKAGLSYNEAKLGGDKAQAQGQYDLALRYFKKAEVASMTPKAKGAAANRQGLAMLEARRPKEAVAHFERAVKAEPNEKIFLNNLGLAHWTLYDAGLGDNASLKMAVDAFYKANAMDASYHGDNLRMALDELKAVDPEAAKAYDSQKDPATGEAAPMGSPTAK